MQLKMLAQKLGSFHLDSSLSLPRLKIQTISSRSLLAKLETRNPEIREATMFRPNGKLATTRQLNLLKRNRAIRFGFLLLCFTCTILGTPPPSSGQMLTTSEQNKPNSRQDKSVMISFDLVGNQYPFGENGNQIPMAESLAESIKARPQVPGTVEARLLSAGKFAR